MVDIHNQMNGGGGGARSGASPPTINIVGLEHAALGYLWTLRTKNPSNEWLMIFAVCSIMQFEEFES